MRLVQKKALLLAVFLFATAAAIPAPAQRAATTPIWVGTWAASQQVPEPQNALPANLHNFTMREIFHVSEGGKTLRIHLSNAFGTEPLHFSEVHIAKPLSPSSPQIDPATNRALTFSGSTDVTVPAGAQYISDPIDYSLAPLSNLAITFHLDSMPAQQTGHPGSRSTSYYVAGNAVASADFSGAKTIDHWYQISGIDVLSPPGAAAIVALGDSITDGHASTTNGNDRWTDALAERLQASSATRQLSVLNQGIGGNHLLTDGLGPNVLARFDRDVLAQSGVQYVIVLEGVNDLGGLTFDGEMPLAQHSLLVHRILSAYEQIILRAHADGLTVIGATILPYMGSTYYHPGPRSEADRQAVNRWIRTPGHFDAVIDFDQAMRDPHQLDHLLPAYDSGDHLHPSPVGYRAMANAISLSLFTHRP